MKINFFPRSFVESFSLSDLRLVCFKIEEYCFAKDSILNFSFLKWEQTLILQRFNRRILWDVHQNSGQVTYEIIKPLDYSDFKQNEFCLIDFDLLKDSSLLSLLSESKRSCNLNTVLMASSKMYLAIARQEKLEKFIKKNFKDPRYLSWVGFDPNIKVQTGMNQYLYLERSFETCFLIFKT